MSLITSLRIAIQWWADNLGTESTAIVAVLAAIGGAFATAIVSVLLTNRQIFAQHRLDAATTARELQTLLASIRTEVEVFRNVFLDQNCTASGWLKQENPPVRDPLSVLPQVSSPHFPVYVSNARKIGSVETDVATAVVSFYALAEQYLGWIEAYNNFRRSRHRVLETHSAGQLEAEAIEFVRRIKREREQVRAQAEELLRQLSI